MKKTSEEKETVLKMIKIYCSKKHNSNSELCKECSELRDYCFKRLECCPFGENKGTCGRCEIHCYKAEYREKIKEVMRFSGPRIIIYEPRLALKHLIKGLRHK